MNSLAIFETRMKMVRKDRSWLGHQSLRNPVHATITLNTHSLELALLCLLSILGIMKNLRNTVRVLEN